MSPAWIAAIASSVIPSAVVVVAFWVGARSGAAARRRRADERQAEVADMFAPMCGCGHRLNFHREDDGTCRHVDVLRGPKIVQVDDMGERISSKPGVNTKRCDCQRFLGPDPTLTREMTRPAHEELPQ